MTSERVNRHKARMAKLKTLREHSDEIEPYCIPITPARAPSTRRTRHDDVLSSFMHDQKVEMENICAPITASTHEVDGLLLDVRSRWNDHQMSMLLSNCRTSTLNSIVGPFGLGSVVAAMDKIGGNVMTAHNAKQDIYARPEDEYRRADYAGSKYATAQGKYKDEKIIENSQMIQDEYSGNYLDYSEVDCDHIKPAKTYHQESGFMQSKKTKEEFGADPDNFAMTSGSGNSSMKAKDKKVWQEMAATDGNGLNNKEVHGHDNRRVNAAIERGNKTAAKYAPTMAERATYYGKRAAITGVSEAGKMGFQQSLGLLLSEFFIASFDEISDAYKNGPRGSLKSNSFFEALRTRLARIAGRVADRWKDAVIAFKEGAISGFLSNLVTMLINMLITTGKRIVRVIREGFMSILKALKMALFPPEGMTRTEAADVALKLLATGVTISLGILAEEVVEKLVAAFFNTNMPPLAPYASMVSAVFVGAMTGIASALLIYGLDKLDLFGVNNQREHTFVLQELDILIAKSDSKIESMYQDEMGKLDNMLRQLGVS